MTWDPCAYHSFMAYLVERMTQELQVLLNESQSTLLSSLFYAYCSSLHCRGREEMKRERGKGKMKSQHEHS